MNNQDSKISQNRAKKEELVAQMQTLVKESQGMVFTNFEGLTHQQLERLKHAIKKMDGKYVAVKNTLLLLALKEQDLSEEDKKHFEKPTAALFMKSDVIGPLKELSKMIKETEKPTIKLGILEGKIISSQDVLKLATLPPLDTLRAQLLGQMLSPVQSLHRALSWNMQTLVRTLQAISDKKSAN